MHGCVFLHDGSHWLLFKMPINERFLPQEVIIRSHFSNISFMYRYHRFYLRVIRGKFKQEPFKRSRFSKLTLQFKYNLLETEINLKKILALILVNPLEKTGRLIFFSKIQTFPCF